MSGKPWARPHDNGRRVECDRCGESFGPLAPGRPQFCAKCRIETANERTVKLRDGTTYTRDWL